MHITHKIVAIIIAFPPVLVNIGWQLGAPPVEQSPRPSGKTKVSSSSSLLLLLLMSFL